LPNLKKLREAKSLDDLARILGFTPSGLAYVLYKLPRASKYKDFDIPKRDGGERHIRAPQRMLRLLQSRLAELLYDCLGEIRKANPNWGSAAHGFERSRSIITNASRHKRRRYVLNLDLEDFFPSINFGRVRGFFIKDKHFALYEKVATVVAQIACHDNELPQGSPCSPVISNLVGQVLDSRLTRLAKTHKCTYSRYADDITFSTGRKDFPVALAAPMPGSPAQWQLGDELISEIRRSGFSINDKKTRMQLRGSRQVATGLIVNEKVNIRPEYYRSARAMCHELFSKGHYYRTSPRSGDEDGDGKNEIITNLNPLEGVLAHIHHIRDRADRRSNLEKKREPTSHRRLYSQFLFYKNFVRLEIPLIVSEGKTDVIYLKIAIWRLLDYQPRLGKVQDGKFVSAIRFMNYSHTVHDILQLGGGTGDLKHLIARYQKTLRTFKHAPLLWPVIIAVDNDDGARDVFAVAKANGGPTISHATTAPFYHLGANLYLVKTPENGADHKTCIEDLFPRALLDTVIDGKTFDPNKEHEAEGKYGKLVFAERVVKPNADSIDFSRFGQLLNRVVAVLDHYEGRKALALAI
jgi:RNA-directed DNA polymerase